MISTSSASAPVQRKHAETFVDADAPLPGPVTLERLQPVARRRPEILETPRQVDLLELAQRRTLDAGEPCDSHEAEQGFRVGAPERPDRHVE